MEICGETWGTRPCPYNWGMGQPFPMLSIHPDHREQPQFPRPFNSSSVWKRGIHQKKSNQDHKGQGKALKHSDFFSWLHETQQHWAVRSTCSSQPNSSFSLLSAKMWWEQVRSQKPFCFSHTWILMRDLKLESPNSPSQSISPGFWIPSSTASASWVTSTLRLHMPVVIHSIRRVPHQITLGPSGELLIFRFSLNFIFGFSVL